MAVTVNEINCPGCNAPVAIGQKQCKWCRRPVMISTLESIHDVSGPELNKYVDTYKKALNNNSENSELNESIAVCYMKLRMYDKALPFFDKAIENGFDNSDLFMYAAICLMQGKRPFVCTKDKVDKAIEYLNAAIMISNKGIYHYLIAYLKYDFYEMKRLRTTPSSVEELNLAVSIGLSYTDVTEVFTLLNQDKPEGF